MTTLILRELARWARAVGAPIAVLAIVTIVPTLSPFGFVSRVSGRALLVGWLAAVMAALAWMMASAVRAAREPARHRRAFEHLEDLRVRSNLPDHMLLCVLGTVWSTPAGELISTVDVRSGVLADVWLAESSLPKGSYALVRVRGGIGLLVEAALPSVVQDAQHHGRARRAVVGPASSRRSDQRAAASVIHAAEALLK